MKCFYCWPMTAATSERQHCICFGDCGVTGCRGGTLYLRGERYAPSDATWAAGR